MAGSLPFKFTFLYKFGDSWTICCCRANEVHGEPRTQFVLMSCGALSLSLSLSLSHTHTHTHTLGLSLSHRQTGRQRDILQEHRDPLPSTSGTCSTEPWTSLSPAAYRPFLVRPPGPACSTTRPPCKAPPASHTSAPGSTSWEMKSRCESPTPCFTKIKRQIFTTFSKIV